MEQQNKGMKTFTTIWLGQLVSVMGTGLTNFALGVWVLRQSGSVSQYATMILFASLPALFLAPFAGVLVDRWNRRTSMLVSDTISGICTLIIAFLLFQDLLEIWHLYILVAVSAAASTLQAPAFIAAITQLVPQEHLARASGLAQLNQALPMIVAPILAGFLMVTIDIEGVILIDCVTFLFATITLMIVKIPSHQPTNAAAPSMFKEAFAGWTYIKERPAFLWILAFFFALNFCLGFANILMPPMVLSFASETALGTVITAGGAGMLAGSSALASWGGPKKRIHGVLGFGILCGFGLMIAGVQPFAIGVVVGFFIVMFSAPFIMGSSQVIWQLKTDPAYQGRVFAMRGMLATMSAPLAYLLAGPLADNFFEPMFMDGGQLVDTIGGIIGQGKGRGVGFMLILSGAGIILFCLLGYLSPRLRNVETELPDAVTEQAPAAPQAEAAEEPQEQKK